MPVAVSAVLGAMSTVPRPAPRMRSERAPSAFTGAASVYVPVSRQTVPPPAAFTWSTAAWSVSVPAACDRGVTQTVQAQLSPSPPSGGHSRRQSVCEPGNVTVPRRA